MAAMGKEIVFDDWGRVSSLVTPNVLLGDDSRGEPTRWIIHSECLVDDPRLLWLSISQVQLPDGVHFEQYVLRMPKAAMTVVLDDARALHPPSSTAVLCHATKTALLLSSGHPELPKHPTGSPASETSA